MAPRSSVSIVLPALDDRDLLTTSLPLLLEERDRRGSEDEVIVVDDTGRDVLGSWLADRFPDVRCVANEKNRGFGPALLTGFQTATHPLVFAMNPDVRVRPGFLDPLVACLEEEDVHAAVPRVLLGGQSDAIESLVRLELDQGEIKLRQPALGKQQSSAPGPIRPVPVPFAIGGAMLMRRAVFLDAGGFDSVFAPFYWEDVDFGWELWKRGFRVLYQPASIVEHHHRGTIGRVVPRELVRAAIEKNRLLFQWKHLDGPELIREHMAYLYRATLDAWLGDRREELVWLALALEQRAQVLAQRGPEGKQPSFSTLLGASTEHA